MSRHHLRLLVVAALLGLTSAAVPAIAVDDRSSTKVDERLLGVSRVVERVEIGVLGSDAPPRVRSRTLRGASASRTAAFDVGAAAASIQSNNESCYYARPSWRRYNGFGKLSSKAWYYIEWCGRDGKVTRVLTLYCGGLAGGGFSYDRCSIRRGATGYSRLNVSGTWKFPFRVGIYTFLTRTVTVSARHYPDGRASGTWWMYQ